MIRQNQYRIVMIGGSAGSASVIPQIIHRLPRDLPVPVIIIRHIAPDYRDQYIINKLDQECALTVKEADHGEFLQAGTVYFAPPNYHLLVEGDFSISLNVDPKINYSRPSIDVSFESAVDACGGENIIGVLLTGANADGAYGLKLIKEQSGYVISQNPDTAEYSTMPTAAVKACLADKILEIDQISSEIVRLLSIPSKPS